MCKGVMVATDKREFKLGKERIGNVGVRGEGQPKRGKIRQL